MKKRIFAAVDVSEDAQRTVMAHVENLRRGFPEARVGWIKPEKLHLTLKFVGEIDNEQLAAFTRAVEATARKVSCFDLQIEGAGVFPSPRNARVLWLGLKDKANDLRKLNEVLERECEREGFAAEKRSFKPHLTIARIKFKPNEALIKKHLYCDFEPPASFVVPEIVVYQSDLLPGGSKYSVVTRARLASGE